MRDAIRIRDNGPVLPLAYGSRLKFKVGDAVMALPLPEAFGLSLADHTHA